jgi:hypothetical protein
MPDLIDVEANSEYELGSGSGAPISTCGGGVLEPRVKMGGSNLWDPMETNEESRKRDHEEAVLEDDWGRWCADFEDKFLANLQPRFWLNKERRYQKGWCNSAMPRSNRSAMQRFCPGINQDLFPEDQIWAVASDHGSPPLEPMVIGLEEFIDITKRKRAKPQLMERKIQVIERRLAKFVLPIWKLRKRVDPCWGYMVDVVEKKMDTIEMKDAGKSSVSNVHTRSNPWAPAR